MLKLCGTNPNENGRVLNGILEHLPIFDVELVGLTPSNDGKQNRQSEGSLDGQV